MKAKEDVAKVARSRGEMDGFRVEGSRVEEERKTKPNQLNLGSMVTRTWQSVWELWGGARLVLRKCSRT